MKLRTVNSFGNSITFFVSLQQLVNAESDFPNLNIDYDARSATMAELRWR